MTTDNQDLLSNLPTESVVYIRRTVAAIGPWGQLLSVSHSHAVPDQVREYLNHNNRMSISHAVQVPRGGTGQQQRERWERITVRR